MAGGHADNRLDSWRTGLLVLAVALAAGWTTARLRHSGEAPGLADLSRPAMGTMVQIRAVPFDDDAGAARTAEALNAAMTEVARIDSLFAADLPRPAGLTPRERAEIRRELLEIGLEAMRESDGAFDARLNRLIRLWGFADGAPRVPDVAEIAPALLDLGPNPPSTVEALEARPQLLYFGAWAKGYAVDRALARLRADRVPAALIDAGGEVRGYGRDWIVGVRHPRLPGALMARLRPAEKAVATSGDYEQTFERDGVRYHHLLDPRTGHPARGCRSVTVLADACARADALATAVFVLGPVRGMALVEAAPGVEALIVDADGGRHDSSGLDAYLVAD